jgi:hypothetical protein
MPKSAALPATRRSAISLDQKRAVRTHKSQHPQLSNLAIKQWFEDTYDQRISPASISEILSPKYTYLDDLKKPLLKLKHYRRENWPELEVALFSWMQHAEHSIAVSREVLRQKADFFWRNLEAYKGLEMPKFSNGWLDNFQRRNGIQSRVKFGEAASAKDATAEMDCIRQLLSRFEPCDIFNCDETGLFWKLLPDRSLTTSKIPGRKKQRSRVTFHFCTNMDGSIKLAPWVIGTAKNPHAFRRANIRIQNLGIFWRANKKAWMVTSIMEEWLRWFDTQMRLRGRSVVLLMDNFSAHEAAVENIRLSTPLTNTLIVWLPPNSTSKYQPLDQGIIRTWKAFWKREWIQYMLAEYDAGRDPLEEVNILIAIRWATRAWNFDVSEKTIINCFYRAFSLETRVGTGQLPTPPMDDILQGITRLEQGSHIHEAMDVENFLNPEGELVQDDSESAEELVLSQIQGPTSIQDIDEDEDEGEDKGEAIPRVPISQGIEAIRMARLLEEQDEEGDLEAIQVLTRLERKYVPKEVNSRRQGDIRSWFG